MTDITRIIEAHKSAANTYTALCVPLGEGELFILFAREVGGIEVGTATVTLLSRESNPRNWIPDPLASENFETALIDLLRTRQPFCSIPRHGWVFPPYQWSVIVEMDLSVLN